MASKSYADIAQKIINKYAKRGDSDVWANTAKEMQLKQLMNKQEAERERMGLVDKPQMKFGGKMKYDGFEETQFLQNNPEQYGPVGSRSYNLFNGLVGDDNNGYDDNYSSNFQASVETGQPIYNEQTTNNYSPIFSTTTAEKSGQNAKFNYLDALSLAPVGYNLYQGLTKEQRLNPKDYQVNQRIKPYTLNYDPLRREALSSNRALNKDILSTGNKSVGDIIRNLRGSRRGYLNQVSDITAKEQMGNAAIDMQAQQGNVGIEQFNKSTKFSVDDWNAKSKAARINMLGAAAEQLGQFAQGKKNDKVTINAINSMLSNYAFDSSGNLVYKATGKVVPPDEANKVKQVMVNK